MKKIKALSILLMVLGMSLTLNAQTEKGKRFLGSETKLNFVSSKSKWKTNNDEGNTGKSSEFEFTPQIGHFISDNTVIGVEIPIAYSSEEYEDDDGKYITSSIAFAPFLRQYFGTTNIKPFFQAELGFGNMNMKYDPLFGSTDDTSVGMFLYEIGGGIAVFINEYVSLDFELGYASLTLKPKEDNNVDYKSMAKGFGFGIGFGLILK